MLDIDTAIKHCLEVAEKNENDVEVYEVLAKNHENTYSKLTATKYATDCAECAADHRQLAEWLTELKELEAKHWDECRQIAHYDDELKDLREENKVLIRECDRLIKEKGELLNKVSGGDVLRIRQLEDRLQVELDNSHCLEIELAEAKRLLKAAVEDMNSNNICFDINACNVCAEKNCISCYTFHWRYTDEVKRLLRGGDING